MIDELDQQLGWNPNKISSENSEKQQLRLRSSDSINKSFSNRKPEIDPLKAPSQNFLFFEPYLEQEQEPIMMQEQVLRPFIDKEMLFDGFQCNQFPQENKDFQNSQYRPQNIIRLPKITCSQDSPFLKYSKSNSQANSNRSAQSMKKILYLSGSQKRDIFSRFQPSAISSLSNPSSDSLKFAPPKSISHKCVCISQKNIVIECRACLYSHEECVQGICSRTCVEQKADLPSSQMKSRISKSTQLMNDSKKSTDPDTSRTRLFEEIIQTCFNSHSDLNQPEQIQQLQLRWEDGQLTVEKLQKKQNKKLRKRIFETAYHEPTSKSIKEIQKPPMNNSKNKTYKRKGIFNSLEPTKPNSKEKYLSKSQIKCTCRNCECSNFSCNCRRWNKICNEKCDCDQFKCRNHHPRSRIFLNKDLYQNQICIESEVVEIQMPSQIIEKSSQSSDMKLEMEFSSPHFQIPFQ